MIINNRVLPDRTYDFYLLITVLIFSLIIPLVVSVPSQAVEISNIEFNLKDSPGSTSRHEFTVANDEAGPINVTIEVGDWFRNLQGTNRFIGENAARWKAPGFVMTAGEQLTITYRAKIPRGYTGQFSIEGTVNVTTPDTELKVYGDVGYKPGEGQLITRSGGGEEDVATITRTITPITRGDNQWLKVSVKVTAKENLKGIALSEKFPVNTKVENIDSSGIPVEYVSRSAADWIEVSPTEFTLNPGEEREVSFTVTVPPNVEGTHWAAIYVSSEPVNVKEQGTTIVALRRFAVKIYETIPGTVVREAYVTGFSAITRSIPKFDLEVVNKGNVQLKIAGKVRLRDATGKVVDAIEVNSFPLLPGYKRELIIRGKEVTNLPPGDYNAVAILDYGGQNKIGKSISFEIEPLNLQPIGASPSLPKDPDEDGLYEDIDGNGQLERIDALIFSFNYDSSVVQENGRAFDFNLDGTVDINDATELLSMAKSG